MQRVRDLVVRVEAAHPTDDFLSVAMDNLSTSRTARAHYKAYDRALSVMDTVSLEKLYHKAISHFTDHRRGQLKQGFFNQLNDCFAYRHLINQGCKDVAILDEGKSTQPDIFCTSGGAEYFCEVKTIGISDEEAGRRGSGLAFTAKYHELSEGFFRKLNHDIEQANAQIKSRGPNGLVFIVVTFDDFSTTYYQDHRRQLRKFLESHLAKNIYIKAGIVGTRCVSNCRLSAWDANEVYLPQEVLLVSTHLASRQINAIR